MPGTTSPSVISLPLILASSSPYRRELLSRLRLPFEVVVPQIDEQPLAGESPERLVSRLAEQKARAVAETRTSVLVIGSDQVAVVDGQIINKPGSHQHAVEQLKRQSGQRIAFLTGLCVYNSQQRRAQTTVVPFYVLMRRLSDQQIERYLQIEQPYNCAGSFKAEGLGSALFERLEGDDPTSLIGLPLIALTRMLENEGLMVI